MLKSIFHSLYLSGFKRNELSLYSICIALSVPIFSFFIRWTPWNTRYFLTLFVLSSIPVGYYLGLKLSKKQLLTVILLLFFVSFVYLILNFGKPVTRYSHNEYRPNIFESTKDDLYFASYRDLKYKKTYEEIFKEIKKNNISKVGLIFQELNFEYPIWKDMKKLGYPFEIRHIDTLVPFSTIGQEFTPDLVIYSSLDNPYPDIEKKYSKIAKQIIQIGNYSLFFLR